MLAENNLTLKHKLKNDAVISSNLFSAIQLNILNEKYRFENKLDLTYDNSKESVKFHDFYEIVDHEHEKLEQTKLNLFFSHKGTYIKNANKNSKYKYDGKGDEYKYGINFNFKKQNFLIDGLEFKNDFSLEKEIRTTQSFKMYNSVAEIYTENPDLIPKILDKVIAKEVSFEPDRSKIVFVEERENYKTKEKYYIKNTLTPIEYDGKKKRVTDTLKIENKTKATYTYNKIKFEATNEFNLNKDYLKESEDKITNKFLINAQKRFNGYFVINPRIGNETKYFEKEIYNGTGKALETALLTGVDLKYVKNEGPLNLEAGIDLGANLQFRKVNKNFFFLTAGRSEASLERLPDNLKEYIKNEKNKFVFGPKFTIKPHLSVKYQINDNLSVNSDAEIEFVASKNVYQRLHGDYIPVDNKITFKDTTAKIKLGINYNW